jgi:TnpA family transposase
VIANATFAARQAWLWGEGSTAVASDSTHFRAWDQNIFTEWHSRYRNGKRGVLIYVVFRSYVVLLCLRLRVQPIRDIPPLASLEAPAGSST